MIRNWRAAAVALGAALAGAFAFAAPAAAAGVTVTPSAAARGGSAELAFQLPEERPGAYTTKVELAAPESTPIAEIYPMSAADWAPLITTRRLDQPVELIHGTSTTDVVSTITWSRVTGAAPAPGQPVKLSVALGPLPDVDRVVFTLVQTYSDGTVVRWADPAGAEGAQPGHPAPIVTLMDPEALAGGPQAANAAPAAPATSSTGGGDGAYGLLATGLLAALALGAGFDGWLILRTARRTPVAPG